MSLTNICELKYKSFLENFIWKLYLQNLVCLTLYLLGSTLADTAVYHLCPRMIHGRGIPVRSIFPQLTLFLELSKARASEAPVLPRTATFHIARPRQKSYPRTCYARHIRCKSTFPKARLLGVEVPNELPLKSNSRFAR